MFHYKFSSVLSLPNQTYTETLQNSIIWPRLSENVSFALFFLIMVQNSENRPVLAKSKKFYGKNQQQQNLIAFQWLRLPRPHMSNNDSRKTLSLDFFCNLANFHMCERLQKCFEIAKNIKIMKFEGG